MLIKNVWFEIHSIKVHFEIFAYSAIKFELTSRLYVSKTI